jgi:hypothetical protein
MEGAGQTYMGRRLPHVRRTASRTRASSPNSAPTTLAPVDMPLLYLNLRSQTNPFGPDINQAIGFYLPCSSQMRDCYNEMSVLGKFYRFD